MNTTGVKYALLDSNTAVNPLQFKLFGKVAFGAQNVPQL